MKTASEAAGYPSADCIVSELPGAGKFRVKYKADHAMVSIKVRVDYGSEPAAAACQRLFEWSHGAMMTEVRDYIAGRIKEVD